MPSPPSPMLLLSTAALFGRPLADTMRIAASAGFGGVEVMVTQDPATRDPSAIRSLAEEAGLVVGALHAPCLLLTRSVWGTDPVAKLTRAIDAAAEAGVPVVVTHPAYRWQGGFDRWLTEEMPEVARAAGVEVAVENMFPVRAGAVSLRAHRDGFRRHRAVAFDTSHAAVAGLDIVEERRRLGPRIRHVHLSDNAGGRWDSHLPPGRGSLPLDRFLRDLVGAGYTGSVSLEVDLRRYADDGAALAGALAGMRERVETHLPVGP